MEKSGYYQFKTNFTVYANKMEEGISQRVKQFRMRCGQYQKVLVEQ